MKLAQSIVASVLALRVHGQSVPAQPHSSAPTIQTASSLVLVPTLVRSSSGELILGMDAHNFRITDNGVEQRVSLEEVERQPLSILVVMQTGGAAARQFQKYRKIGTMLDYMAGNSTHEAAVMTFDSEPEDFWSFTDETADLKDAFVHPVEGNRGAAVLDAVNEAIDLLTSQPASRKRIILLLSQTQDDGSKVKAEDIVRRLGENNITIFSVSFSAEKTWLKDQFTKPRHGNAPYDMPGRPGILYTFDLSTPLGMALKAMREDTAAEVATLSGGEHIRFDDARSLERQMATLANHLPNRYLLSFRPSVASKGFHSIRVEVLGQDIPLDITARAGYWYAENSPPGDRGTAP